MGVKGAILGDIIGSQYEFTRMRPADLDWKNVPLLTKKCRRTDDSILTLATKGAILENDTEPDFTKWYWNMGNKYNGGYGGMFRQWLASENPQPYNSFGNGSAMRCSFIGECYSNPEDVIKIAKQSAMVTHNHPQGVKGAVVTAACIAMAKRGDTKQQIYDYVCRFYVGEDRYDYPITMSLAEMRRIYKWDVSCQGSVPAAIRCVLEADSYEEFIRNVMSLPCDMDTLGAIGGGIAEELFGLKEFDIPEIFSQYLEPYLCELALK